MHLCISTVDIEWYNFLADGCHEISYQTGACFEWVNPETEEWTIALWSFKNDEQEKVVTELLYSLCSRALPGTFQLFDPYKLLLR